MKIIFILLILIISVSSTQGYDVVIRKDYNQALAWDTLKLYNQSLFKGIDSIDFSTKIFTTQNIINCGYYKFNYNTADSRFTSNRKIVIYTNEHCDPSRINFFITHELGHHKEVMMKTGVIELSEEFAKNYKIERK